MLAFAAFLLALQAQPAEARRVLPPIDECSADADFAAFRAELLDSLVRRDAAGLRAKVAEDVFFSFGGEEGRGAFFESWGLADPAASGLWTALAEPLLLGCARDGDRMVSPYAFANWPEFDGVGTSFLARAGARLYPRPSLDSDPVATVSWHVVEDASGDDAAEAGAWRRVRLGDGRIGYMGSGDLRSDIDYRAIFERRGGRWLLTVFVAGD